MSGAKALLELARRRKQNKLRNEFFPLYDHDREFGPDNVGAYEWQVRFCNAGSVRKERALIAANRVGKTNCSAPELACHLSGVYPEWWEGKRFTKPNHWWTGSVTNEASRDIVQLALLGEEGAHGTGWVPGEALVMDSIKYRQAGVPNVVDGFKVKFITGGYSSAGLKTYDQGRRKWQGTKKDGVWFDEEPPGDIYSEGMTRTMDTMGLVMCTFTPLEGATEVVNGYING